MNVIELVKKENSEDKLMKGLTITENFIAIFALCPILF
jgi:hypothetical protein